MQDFDNYEHILIDDCSQDNTLSIINKYAEDDKHIKILKNEKNL
jgi:glycosyltransferase involved in cell wall biosynthesis